MKMELINNKYHIQPNEHTSFNIFIVLLRLLTVNRLLIANHAVQLCSFIFNMDSSFGCKYS